MKMMSDRVRPLQQDTCQAVVADGSARQAVSKMTVSHAAVEMLRLSWRRRCPLCMM
jgi:hypothetical protein